MSLPISLRIVYKSRESITPVEGFVKRLSFSFKELKTLIEEKTKDWYTYGEDKEENKRQKNMFLWNAFL